ncbi:hypothetical protein DFA_00105 [Cavenderia fasciculata]|uniref:ubiquitinyl hydrolase 1 n=1 Tax=Cavenderia fasciculata TaxID=261658 RepID=F4PXL7_CACFS|nr:uncharacterized protein DFA_00105 [Cavenderia fasciculata]EGG19527.1 hypothetical protein DFA_00105 [Cavenderia fasciculata]|eukprot:XP_004357821.1 hypothetical protein DFA_00105 [Cavenderia fasciculata]
MKSVEGPIVCVVNTRYLLSRMETREEDQLLAHLFMPMRIQHVSILETVSESTLFHSFIQHIISSTSEKGGGIVSSALNQFSDDIKQPPNIDQLTKRISQSFVDSKDNNNNNSNIPVITYFKKSNCILVIHRPPTIINQNNNNNNNNLIQIYPTLDTFNVQTTKLQMATPICSFNIQDVNQLLDPVFLEYLVALRDTDQSPIMSIVHHDHYMVPTPNTILNWLIPSIPGCEYNDSIAKYSTPIIYKSIRTEILSGSWMRSPLWVGLKSLTHFLFKRYESSRAYKMAILSFKINTLAKYKVNSQTTLEYIAHIARSCNKFKIKYQKKHPSTVFDFIKSIKEQCETLSDKAHQQWDSFCQHVEKEYQISPSINNICNGLKDYGTDQANLVHQSLQQNIQSFINNLKVDEKKSGVKDLGLLNDSASRPSITNLENYSKQLHQLNNRDASGLVSILKGMIDTLSNTNGFTLDYYTDNVTLVITLNIIEEMIFQMWKSQIFRQSLSNGQKQSQDVFSSVYNLMDIYMKLSKPRYDKDAILYSRFILTSFTLVAILDRLTLDYCHQNDRYTTFSFDLYSSLPPYVNLSIFSDLLLQHQYEYDILESLESYFEDQRHCSKTSIDNSIFSVDDNGFGKKWAQQFYQEELQKELDDIEKKKEDKIKEYRDLKAKKTAMIEKLQEKLLLYPKYEGESYSYAQKRKKIERDIKDCFNTTLSIYYKSMPKNKDNQFKLMFEIHIPFYLYYVRNSFALLCKYLYGGQNYYNLTSWRLSPTSSIVSLFGSMPHVPEFLAIFKNPETSFIDWNHKTISRYQYKEASRIEDMTSSNLQKSNLLLSIPSRVEYSQLNWMVQSNHGIEENDVLATQSNTPKGMLPNEYIRYGMLRVGASLSIRNMIRFMEERNNLNGIHVLVMFYQLSMQCGPRKNGQSTNRPFRIGWDDETVLQTLCNTVESILTESELNWERNISMIAMIHCLTIAFNTRDNKTLDDINKSIIKVLEKCRLVLWEWVAKLEQLIQQELLHGRETETSSLRKRMVYTSIAIIMTFNIDNNHKQYIIQHTNYFQHIEYYFKSLIILDENSTYSSNRTRTLGSSCPEQPFLDIIFNQLSLIIYRQIPFIVEHFKDGNHFKCLNNIIHNNQGNDYTWEKGSNNNYYQFKFNDLIVQFNIFDGTLLFNGTFDKRLPTQVVSYPLYKSFFESSIFEVHQNGNSIWTTNQTIEGYKIEFIIYSSRTIGIVQIKDNGERWMLLDPNLFNHLPITLVTFYSHWINMATNEIEFRPRTLQQYKDGGLDSIKFIGTKNGEIKLKSTGDSLLYFGYNNLWLRDQILKIFPIESEPSFHIFEQEASKLYRIHLNQFGLDFIVDCQNQQINSVQYSGYRLCEQQYIGTLVGLKTILVLEQNIASGTKKVILPHSTITLEMNGDCQGFNNAKSSTTTLNHPAYFIYDIDRELKMIKSSDLTAHLHLCYSHIVTSSLFRDPFTGLRGMELANILLKKFNNNMPLNQSQLNILSAISNISPKRTESNHIQQITISRPLLAPMISHYDGFVILVDMIKQSHAKMSFLWSVNQEAAPLTSTLNRIAWNRYKRIYSPHCQIDLPIDTPGSFVIVEPSSLGQNSKNVQRMASIVESKNIQYLCNSFNPFSMIGTSTIYGLDFTDRQNCVPEFQETNNLINTRYIDRQQQLGGAFTYWYLKLLKIAMETASGHYNLTRFRFVITLLSYFWSDSSLVPLIDHLVLIAISKPLPNVPSFPLEKIYVEPMTTYEPNFISSKVKSSIPDARYPYSDTYEEMVAKREKIEEARSTVIKEIFDQNIWDRVNETIISPSHTSYKSVSNPHFYYEKSFNDQIQIYGRLSGLSYFNGLPSFMKPRVYHLKNQFNQQIYNSKLFDKEIPKDCMRIWELGYDQQLESIWSPGKISFGKLDNFINGIYHQTHLEEELFDDLNISKESLKNNIQQSKTNILNSQTLGRDLERLLVIIQQRVDLVWNIILEFYNNPKRTDQSQQELDGIFKSCHSWIGCVPLTVYEDFSNHFVDLPDQIYQLIGVHIILQTYKQKIQKCKTIQGVDLVKELSQSRETRKWLPKDYPTWLVFELEQSIWIRDTQAEIAIKLINAQSNECVQLQMGEGKTSVILPIMCLAISDKQRIARVNAIPSLLQTYIQDLQMRLGSSILNRPIHLYPFKRDIGPSISESHVQYILSNIEKCKQMNGIILCTPEHRLSFNLFWRLAKDKNPLFDSMGNVIKWWNDNIFDIMDECDDLLSHKYQLLYPIGSKVPIDGGSDRWNVIEEVLSELKLILQHHYKDYQDPFIFRRFTSENENNQDQMKKILSVLLETLINKLPFNTNEKNLDLIKQFVGPDEDTISQEHHKALSLVEKLDKHQTRILVYRGLFSYEVLLHSLTKTWSKHYGIRSTASSSFKRDSTLLAVPFRAKDTPSERAEYGHPDFVIILTFIAYYNQGLTFNQFQKALDCLISSKKHDASDIYRSWTDYDQSIEEKYRDFRCVVNSDNQLIKHLYSLFKFNCRVINFWLNELVFPYETKQYPSKLFANPWDLVYPKSNSKKHISCGFSGTNDTKCLYPLTIQQNDLDRLKYTNVQVLNYILDQNDQSNKVHIVDDKNILEEIVKLNNNQSGHYFNILIDAGALMIGKSNEDVVKRWLELESATRIDGALFFENDKLTTIDREGKKFIFSQSPLSDRLDRVLVYLDDYHTRGVDIKLPINSNAIVTVGNKITKEKLLQACMRMRKLGQGQTISILISKNLGIELKNDRGELEPLSRPPDILDILKWTIQNTIEFITNSFIQWTFQGMMNARSKSAISLLEMDNVENKNKSTIFSKLVSFPETLSLYDLYSGLYKRENGDVVVSSMVSKLEKKFKKDVGSDTILGTLGPSHSIQANLMSKYAKNKLQDQFVYSNMVEEEQEREFEVEAEVEMERELPKKVNPHIEKIDDGWREILTGSKHVQDHPSIFLPIKDIFKDTNVWKCLEIQKDCFAPTLWTTYNFTKTITTNLYSTANNIDEFVKQINYILVVWNGDTPNMILVSMKEANHLIKILDQLSKQEIIIFASIHQSIQRDRPIETIQKDRPGQTEYFNKISTRSPSSFSLQPNYHAQIRPLLNQINVLNGSKYFDYPLEIYQFLGIFRCGLKEIMSKLINNDFIDQFGFVLESVKPSDIDKLSIDDDLFDQLLSIIKTRRFKKCPIDLLEQNLQLQRVYSVGVDSHIKNILIHCNNTSHLHQQHQHKVNLNNIVKMEEQDDQVLSHLFMSMRLPDTLNTKAEMTLFHSFIQDINNWDEEGIVSLALKQFSDDINQPPDIDQLTNRITQSFINETKGNNNNNDNNDQLNNIPLITYFKKSNCILVIHRPPTITINNNNDNNNNSIILDLIQIYPTLEDFNVETTKIKMAAPICSFNIQDVNQLLDPVFLEYLVALRDTDQPPIMSVVRSQHNVIPTPNTIINWLIPSIPGCEYNDSTTNYSTPFIYKSIRPEILNIGDNLVWMRSPLWVGLKSLTHFLFKRYESSRDYKMLILAFKMDTLQNPEMVFNLIKSIKDMCQTLSDKANQQWDSFCQAVENDSDISTSITKTCNGLKGYGNDQTNLVHQIIKPKIKSFIKNLKVDEMKLDVKGVNTLTDSASNSSITDLKILSKQLNSQDVQASFPTITFRRWQPATQPRCILIGLQSNGSNDNVDSTPTPRYNLYRSLPPYVNISIFSDILLQQRSEYEIRESLDTYFKDYRNCSQTSIENSIFSIEDKGFGERWAESFLQEELKQELEDIETKKEAKIKECQEFKQSMLDKIKKLQPDLRLYRNDSRIYSSRTSSTAKSKHISNA